MSSAEDDANDHEGGVQNSKKRRVQRACDICRRKKVRCDGGSMPGNRCSNCVTYHHECTYIEAAKKRGPPKGYVESLENRLQKMENLLQKLCPDADFSAELGAPLDKDTWYSDRGEKSGNPLSASAAASPIPPAAPNPEVEELVPSDDEITAQRDIIRNIKQLDINSTHSHLRFFGKSSSVMFIQTAIEAKHEYAGLDLSKDGDQGYRPLLESKRPQFWELHPWISGALSREKPKFIFPEEDLFLSLIDLFFDRINDYQPLLHRPTFEEQVQEGLHYREEGFGSVVLLLCAVAARFSDDPRVFLEGSNSTHSSGWEWFRQVHLVRKSLLAPPSLYDLQMCVLTAIFLQSTSAPQACWTIIGVGIRLAQDVGAHRRKVYHLSGAKSGTVEQELWKRAFWVLVSMDRATSMTLGRPCAIQDEDFDLELPVECDDEYWERGEHPEHQGVKVVTFKQPPGKPSKITFFNCFLRLNQILAFALRTIYSINKSKALLGFVGTQWEQHIVAELDSALNKWIDSVPDHLRWDASRENDLFLNQSASLFAHYYQLQISVHRPFIPSPRKPSPLSFPSLAICTNAARSCTHVLDVPFRKTGTVLYANMMALFTSGIVLLLNIWGGKRSGLTTDPAKEMADVHKCMKMLKSLEPRWHTAGRLWDVLYELASVGDLPLPQPSPTPSQKRDREESMTPSSMGEEMSAPLSPASATTGSSPSSVGLGTFGPTGTGSGSLSGFGGATSASPTAERQFAGSRRVSQQLHQNGSQAFAQPAQPSSLHQHHSHPLSQGTGHGGHGLGHAHQQHHPYSLKHSQVPYNRAFPGLVHAPYPSASTSASTPAPSTSASTSPTSTTNAASTSSTSTTTITTPTTPFVLPIYTEELGRMPLHPGSAADYSASLNNWRQGQQQPGGGQTMTATAAAAGGPSATSGGERFGNGAFSGMFVSGGAGGGVGSGGAAGTGTGAGETGKLEHLHQHHHLHHHQVISSGFSNAPTNNTNTSSNNGGASGSRSILSALDGYAGNPSTSGADGGEGVIGAGMGFGMGMGIGGGGNAMMNGGGMNIGGMSGGPSPNPNSNLPGLGGMFGGLGGSRMPGFGGFHGVQGLGSGGLAMAMGVGGLGGMVGLDGMQGILGTGPGAGSGGGYPDSDTLAMWSNAPQGFEWDDWGTFISHGLGPQPTTGGGVGGRGPGGGGPSSSSGA